MNFQKIKDHLPIHDSTQIIMMVAFLIILILIPLGTFLLSQRLHSSTSSTTSQSKTPRNIKTTSMENEATSSSVLEDLKKVTEDLKNPDEASSGSVIVSFGPTLNLKIAVDGRGTNNAIKTFVGIAAGAPSNTPNYLLSFTVTFPSSGVFEGLSLAGLNTNQQYTAYIKGPAQLATASAFIMSPTTSYLNGGNPITLLSGDLNNDNIVDLADVAIVRTAYGATATSAKWNELADLNGDGIINSVDLGIVMKNFEKTGSGGSFKQPIASTSATTATGSAVPLGGSQKSNGGYWIWVPN
jgi:hypothetical protein